MAVLDAIKQARARGASDDEILSAIEAQNPNKAPTIQEAKRRGADSATILSEIEKQNQQSGVQKVIGAVSKVKDAMTGFYRGAGKGIASTLTSGAEIVEKGGTALARAAAGGKLAPEAEERTIVTKTRDKLLAPQGTAEKVGKTSEQIAEYFTPAAVTSKAQRIPMLSRSEPFLKQVAQAWKVGIVEALESGAITAMQTADPKSTGLTAGIALALPVTFLALTTPLTKAAEKIYASAAKFTKTAQNAAESRGIDLVRTGLDERVFLSQGGVERVAAKIDDMERLLGSQIDDAGAAGAKISTRGMQSYVDEAKELFKYDVDVKASEQAMKELDDLVVNFKKQYGDYIPVEVAQQIKVKTGQMLAKYYARMTSAAKIEGSKQMVRFLKDKIVEAAPEVGDINKRLAALYQLDKALDSSVGRIKNLNLLGLGTKILMAGGTKETTAVAAVLQVLGAPLNKSGIAIGLNELAKLSTASAQAGRIPLQLLVRFIYDKVKNQGEPEQ